MSTSRERANAIRALAMMRFRPQNQVTQARTMGMADMAEVLWGQFLKHNPGNPNWWDRDRLLLSNGHGSMLIYSLLHLTGYDVSLDDLKAFRQLGSKTPGHPELGYTPGVETTTGPLGQGLANAVGLALGRNYSPVPLTKLARTAEPFKLSIITPMCLRVMVGLMEGVSHEVCSLAGTLGLGKLICLYDDNGISIDGPVTGWFTDDTAGAL